MKISKLFHWLYAFVMLLPVFAIGVTCGYAMFNKNAYRSYYGETINEKESIYLNENITNGTDVLYVDTTARPLDNSRVYLYDFELTENGNLSETEINTLNSNEGADITIGFYDNGNINIQVIVGGNRITLFNTTRNFVCEGIVYETNGLSYKTCFYYEYNKDSFVSEVFYYSVDRVKEAPIFSWAYNSFLATPIVYITGLFSIPSSHLVVQLLSYWLAISIIWLVFDLIMYVPLLVHRWIDKGVLE